MKTFTRAISLILFVWISAAHSQSVHTITITDFSFTPDNITVLVGDTVKWSYTSGSNAHNVMADNGSFTSGPPALPPWTYKHVFTSAGNNPYYCEPHGGPGGSGMSGVIIVQNPVSVDDGELVADKLELMQNYPNPFNPSTNIGFRISDRGFVSLKVYNILGDEVATLVNEEKQSGVYEVVFSAKGGSASGRDAYSLSSGIYFYKLQAGSFVETKKMILLR